MRSTLKQFVRDWTAQGKEERDQCYLPLKEEFKKYFPNPIKDGQTVKVLFPGIKIHKKSKMLINFLGAGLGRLVYDFAVEGYASQGNEFSYFMLISSNFVLNLIEQKEQFVIQPFIHNFSNIFEEKDPFEVYKIPDVNPSSSMPSESDFSMVAGEFVEVYEKQDQEWDSVITCFFLDTANNVIEYIKTIAKILKKNGVWLNLGPLLYHYSDMEEEVSIELSWEELKHVIEKMGFEIKV
jgi:carnosine N-methyltransferase